MEQPCSQAGGSNDGHDLNFVTLYIAEEGFHSFAEEEPACPDGDGPQGRPEGVECEEPWDGNGTHAQGEGDEVAKAVKEPEGDDDPGPEPGRSSIDLGNPLSQSRPFFQQVIAAAAAQVKGQLVPQEAAGKGCTHDPRQLEVTQMRSEAAKNENGLPLEEGADKDSRVAVCDDHVFEGHVQRPFFLRSDKLFFRLLARLSPLIKAPGVSRVTCFCLAACAAVLAPGRAQAAGVFDGRGIVPLLALSFLILTVLISLVLTLLVRKRKELLGFAGSVLASIGQALSENPDVRRLVDRHPRFFSFLGRRLDREVFTGLPATLLALALIFLLFQFLGVVQSLLTADPIVAADLRTANLLATLRTPGLNRFFLFVTLLGKWPVVLAFTFAVSGILLLRKRWGFIPGLWMCLTGASASTWLGKVAFHRQRPAVAEYVEWSYSFPSGHAVISVALYGFLVYLVWRFSPRWRLRIMALLAGTALILAIGTSRLYLGVHYLSDVWGGYLLGFMWLIAGISLSETAALRGPSTRAAPEGPAIRAASWTMAAAALGVYLLLGSVYHPPDKTVSEEPLRVAEQNVSSIFLEHKLPRYTETLTGKDQEPLSFVIAASDDQALIQVFQRAGWTLASSESLGDLVRAGRAAVADKPDPAAPMTPSFWNKNPHDFGFEKPLKKATVRERHHARFWKMGFKTPDGLLLYAGTASLDVGLKWGVAHRIQANIDAEREFLFSDLVGTGLIKSYWKADFVEPLFGHNFIGDPFFTDGKIYFVTLGKGYQQ